MKQFIVDRHTTPNTPTLEQVPTEKIPVYEDMAAAAADLANLAENQIIATHDTGSELSAPVDTVQSGNMHAVTSNAVAESLSYSTTEQATGGKWIDGKPIYRRVIVYENQVAQANSDLVINHGILNIDHIIKADILPHYILGEENVMLQWNLIPNKWVTPTELKIHNDYGSALTFITLEFFIEYTKTTD